MPLDHHLFLEEIKMAHRYPKPLLDTLYCLKDHIHWEEEQVEDDEYSSSTTTTITNTNTDTSSVVFLEHDLFWDREELSSLLAKEHQNQLSNTLLQNNLVLASSREEAVEWILKVNARYSFSTLTAVLAVNYLDRFLFSFRFQNDNNDNNNNNNPWLTQLSAVACLSLAAKFEETHVPLFIDLQVCHSKTLLYTLL